MCSLLLYLLGPNKSAYLCAFKGGDLSLNALMFHFIDDTSPQHLNLGYWEIVGETSPFAGQSAAEWQAFGWILIIGHFSLSCSHCDKGQFVIRPFVKAASGEHADWNEELIQVFLLQNLISVIVVYFLKAVGAITTEPVTWRLVEVWFPVNILFVSMLVTSTYR
jgi:hypothetical protein